MLMLVFWLFYETQRAVNREKQASGKVTDTLWRERCAYAIISVIFALSYIGRYFLNVYDTFGDGIGSSFAQEITYIIVYMFEGASMGVLMMFHLVNFKKSRSILS